MTGYLRALGALAVGAAPTLRPRPRSRFEPARLDGELLGEMDVERVAPAPRATRRYPEPVPGWSEPAPRPLPAGTAPEPRHVPEPIPSLAPSSASPGSTLPDVTPLVPALRASGHRGVEPPSSATSTTRAVTPSAPAATPAPSVPLTPAPVAESVPVTPVSPRPEAPPQQEPSPAPARTEPPEPVVVTRQVVERVVREVEREPSRETPRPVQRRPEPVVVRPRRAVAETRAAVPRRTEPAPAPVIHVSVGRVEVRAVRPAPPAPPPEPSRTPASGPALDEYLAGLGGSR
jgi:hypothetical protein